MAKYTCTNDDCGLYLKEVEYKGKTILVWNDVFQDYTSTLTCEECDGLLNIVTTTTIDLDKISSINKGATKVSSDKRNTIY